MPVVGAKDKPGRAVDRVGRYLMDAGYEVYPVHPVRTTVWGLTAYPNLAALPCPWTSSIFFALREYCPDHAREVLALPWRPSLFWMQLGIRSRSARAAALHRHHRG